MNAFEISVGYRSVQLDAATVLWIIGEGESPTLTPEQADRLAEALFDDELAEILRSEGAWHWQFDEDRIGDIASEVASQFSEVPEEWEPIYDLLLTHYAEQYRAPSKEELEAQGIALVELDV